MGRSISGDTTSNPSKSVLSVDGFQTGDLIYETTGKIGPIPDTFAGATSFSASADLSTARNYAGSLYSTKIAVPTDSELLRCFGSEEPTAVLSDGNIVTAYFGEDINSSNSTVYLNVYFRIDQPDGTPVVAETQINLASTNYQNREGKLLSVNANPSGGFIVAFHAGSTMYLSWKIFTNAGVEQGSQVIKTTWTNIRSIKTSSFGITNEFAIGIVESSNNVYLVRVNASGEQATITVGTTQYGTTLDICSTSYSGTGDLVHFIYTISNQIQRKSYNSTGTLVIQEINIEPSQGGNTIFDVKCDSSSTDSICVVWTQNGQETINTIGVLDGTTNPGNWTERIWLGNFDGASQGASEAGNFVGNISGTNNFLYTVHGYYEILTQVIAYNGTVVSSFTRNLISQSWQGAKGLIKAGTELRYYATSGTNANPQFSTFGGRLSPLQYVVLDPTTYLPSGENSDSVIVDTAQVASSGYVKDSATPTFAKFYAAANSSVLGELPRTSNTASLVQPMTSLGFVAANKIKALELDNGNIAILYANSNVITLKIIDKNYNAVSSTTIVTTNSGNGAYKIDIKRLTNKNIIICFPSSASYTTVEARVYDPTMTTIVTADTVITDTPANSDGADVSIAPIPYSDTKFVFTWKISNWYQSKVLESTDLSDVNSRVVVWNSTATTSASCQTVVDRQGYFYCNVNYNSGGTYLRRAILNSSTFAIETFVTIRAGGASYSRKNSETCLLSDGTVMAPYAESSGQDGVRQLNGTSTSDDNERNVNNGRTDNYGAIQGVTGDGQWFMYQNKNGTNGGILWLTSQEGGNPSFYGFGNYSNGLATGTNQGEVGCTTPSSGSTAHIIAYSTVSSFSIAKVRVRAESYILATTAGVTESVPVSLTGNNAPLIGVAAQDCAAGEVGLVQTKGSASLNTNYPSSTSESFDFRTQTADGVKGFISGRNISLGD